MNAAAATTTESPMPSAGVEAGRVFRNEPGRLVRVEFVTMPPAIVHGEEPRGPLERGGVFVVLFFTDGMTPPVVRTYQPGRRD